MNKLIPIKELNHLLKLMDSSGNNWSMTNKSRTEHVTWYYIYYTSKLCESIALIFEYINIRCFEIILN